ncbi:MAG: hypothetical protein ACYTXY_52770, partial [Nostoc sp.]
MCRLVPSLEAGNVFREALPLVKLLEAEPPRMGSQPPGWEPVRARAVSYLSAIPYWILVKCDRTRCPLH